MGHAQVDQACIFRFHHADDGKEQKIRLLTRLLKEQGKTGRVPCRFPADNINNSIPGAQVADRCQCDKGPKDGLIAATI